jgi:hypothetical protein
MSRAVCRARGLVATLARPTSTRDDAQSLKTRRISHIRMGQHLLRGNARRRSRIQTMKLARHVTATVIVVTALAANVVSPTTHSPSSPGVLTAATSPVGAARKPRLGRTRA